MSGSRKTKITRRDVLKITGGAALASDRHAERDGRRRKR